MTVVSVIIMRGREHDNDNATVCFEFHSFETVAGLLLRMAPLICSTMNMGR